MDNYGYIYVITNTVNNKQYVGQTNAPHRRWIEHKYLGKHVPNQYTSYLYQAMRKYGTNSFSFQILERVQLSQMEEKEKEWITTLNTMAPNGYNLTSGGKLLCGDNNPFYGKKHTTETKQKISEANKGRVASPQEIEMRKRINAGEKNPFYGKKHSPETVEKIKATNRQKGNYQATSIRMKGNNLNRYKKYPKVGMFDKTTLICLKIFTNAQEAGTYLLEQGLTKAKRPSNIITGVCNGYEPTAAGYVWRYLDDEEDVSTTETNL